MKKLFILLITLYQKLISPILENIFGHNICRFNPKCSEYAKIVINENGALKGSYMSILRILKCQPYYRI